MNKTFEQLCFMSQEKLKNYVVKQLKQSHNKVIEDDGFVFAQGKFPVLLVAHLDTVHKELPKTIQYDSCKGIYSSPQGIGGDDRCGVFMIFEVIKKYNCSVLFCEDEEIGTVGAKKFTKHKAAQGLSFNYIIEFDRMNSNDAVFYDCDNDDFEDFITKEFYKTAWGSYSDISVVAPALGCAAVNLSCGYHKAHTTDEYVVEQEMYASIEAACKILERTTDEDKFEYIEAPHYYKYQYGDYYGWYDDYNWTDDYSKDKKNTYYVEYIDEDGEFDFAEIQAHSKTEAIGEFLMKNPYYCFSQVADVYLSLDDDNDLIP